MRLTGVFAEPWEARLLRSMSREYVDGRAEGAEEFAIPPYGDIEEFIE